LFNFVDDPEEKTDLFDSEAPLSQDMRAKLQNWIDTNNADFPALLKKKGIVKTIDPATLEMLRSLGYIY
jgi:hypothetical protein